MVSSTAIESDKKMTWAQLEKEAERRRVKGELSFKEVRDVDMFCSAAYDNQVPMDRV